MPQPLSKDKAKPLAIMGATLSLGRQSKILVLGAFTCKDVDAYHAQLSLGEGTYNHMKNNIAEHPIEDIDLDFSDVKSRRLAETPSFENMDGQMV